MVRIIRNNLALHILNEMRNINTKPQSMRNKLREITKIALSEVMKDFPLEEKNVDTWIGKRKFYFLKEEDIVFIAILRAGLPMLEASLEMLPDSPAGFIGAKRDEKDLSVEISYLRIPPIKNKKVIILDPMLATGNTLEATVSVIERENPERIISIHILASPEAVERFEKGNVEVFTLNVDEKLNSKGFIIPGLGDMGDRLFYQCLNL